MIPKGTPDIETAYKFIAYAARPDVMSNQTKYISYGPTHADAVPYIQPDVLGDLPTAPDNLKTVAPIDALFWADNGVALKERFNAWLAQ